MEGESGPEEATLFPATVGEKLRGAREARGMELSEVAARTRIPQRHLEAIERSNYASLPSSTYALGFAKAYARAVGADEVAIGRELRGELDTNFERVPPQPAFKAEDPKRTPSRGLILGGLLVAVLLIAGASAWYAGLFRPGTPPPESLDVPVETPVAAPTPAASDAPGHVTLTAIEAVWLRVTDAGGKVLYQGEMQPGDHFDVPPDADHPVVHTGRPDKLQVQVNGSNVPALGTGDRTVDVDVSAAALLARGTATPSPTPSPSPEASHSAAAPAKPALRPSPSRSAAPLVPAPLATQAPRPSIAPPSPTPTAGLGTGGPGEDKILRFVERAPCAGCGDVAMFGRV